MERGTVRLSGGVASPCVGVCELDPGSGLCRGCRRTLAEIAAWRSLDDDERRAVLGAVAARAAVAVP